MDNSNGVTTDVSHMFRARNLSAAKQEIQGDERIELVWLPFAEAVRRVMAGHITESVPCSRAQSRAIDNSKKWGVAGRKEASHRVLARSRLGT